MSEKRKIETSLDAERLPYLVFGTCILFAALFFLLDYYVNYSRWTEIGAIRRLFNTTREDGLASWFGVTQTVFVALTVWMLYFLSKGASKWRRRGWVVLGLFFTYMAVDDGSKIHERLGTAFDDTVLTGESMLDAFPSYAWQIAVLPGFVILGLFTFFFLLRELRTRRAKLLIFVALSTLAFAVAIDFIEGLDRDHRLNVYAHVAETYDFNDFTRSRFKHSEYTTLVHFSKSVEETLEMMAMSLIWFVLLQHLLGSADAVLVRFKTRAPARSEAETTEDVLIPLDGETSGAGRPAG